MFRKQEVDAMLARYRERRAVRELQPLCTAPEVLDGPGDCVVIVRPHGDRDLVSLATADQVERVLRRKPLTAGR